MRVPRALIFILCLLVPASLWGGELYNWTDETGVQHFSNQRPENIKNIRVIQGAPDSGSQEAPVKKAAPVGAEPEEATAQPQASAPEQQAASTGNQLRPEDIDRYLGPCYVRFLKRKTPNGSLITTNANWVYQIREPLRPLVVKQWQVGDQLKICREKGFIFNMTRDATVAIEAVRVKKGTS
jgi:hypothetical protein